VLGSSGSGAAFPASFKGVLHSRSRHGSAGDRTVTLAMPFKNTLPTLGKRVGGVSERAGAKAGGSNPFASSSFACRDGRRHPGLLEGDALRGASSERGPRSVRERALVPPLHARAPATADVRRTPRRGTRQNTPQQCVFTRHRHERSSHALGDASFARSSGPCTSILTMHRGSNPRWWGARGGITVGQARASGRNQHWGHHERTECGSPRVTASARERAWHERKGWRSRPPSLRGHEELGFGCPHVDRSCRSRQATPGLE